eukprot:TRINITY_DN7090_c0_g1_i3.p1 TRINITY_DN7090_c0_g1~~TRINITY_DN7090_c0_g1_i3.p1  ORF type:complete len:150 (+),score=24.55 TRINITY_DN7090_c0_g1_i3:429-878(+)
MSLSSKCFSLVLARWKEQEKINVLRAHGIYVESHNLEGNTSKSCSSFLFRLYDMLELQTLEGFQDRQLCVDVWYQSIKEGKMEFSWKEFLDAVRFFSTFETFMRDPFIFHTCEFHPVDPFHLLSYCSVLQNYFRFTFFFTSQINQFHSH